MIKHQIQEHTPASLSQLYQCGYRSIVIVFATIVQQEQSLPTNINCGEINDANSHHCHKQLALLHNIFSEFDRVIFINCNKVLNHSIYLFILLTAS